jgi:hypothetical protein
MKRQENEKWYCLYRHFDEDGILLYIGISISLIGRIINHRGNSFWFDDVATVTVKRFATKREVLDAEKLAIIKENPKHNIKHSLEKSKAERKESDDFLRSIFKCLNEREKCREERNKAGIPCERDECTGCKQTTI